MCTFSWVNFKRHSFKVRSHCAASAAAKNGMHWIQCEFSHCAAAAAAATVVPQGAASKWVPTPFYVAAYVAAAVAKTLAAPLPHRVNEPLLMDAGV